MARFVDRLKSLLARRPSNPARRDSDPLDYDQVVSLDAEDLAEQGILSAYLKLLPELQQHGAAPMEVSEDIDPDTAQYAVVADGQRHQIWEAGAKNDDGWERATLAFFQIVNASLSGSEYKFYALYGGNDLSGIFLTREAFDAARASIAQRSNWPWMPVNEPPRYGYPVDGAA